MLRSFGMLPREHREQQRVPIVFSENVADFGCLGQRDHTNDEGQGAPLAAKVACQSPRMFSAPSRWNASSRAGAASRSWITTSRT
jgi:hypothetical protein